jgi:hypothetical protein
MRSPDRLHAQGAPPGAERCFPTILADSDDVANKIRRPAPFFSEKGAESARFAQDAGGAGCVEDSR